MTLSTSDSFVFWTNKGGVGKTTLCMHSAVTYAALNPRKLVLAIDLDEQANLSQTLLTDVGNEYSSHRKPPQPGSENKKKISESFVDSTKCFVRTLCGALLAGDAKTYAECKYVDVNGNAATGAAAFLVSPKAEHFNSNMPPNLKLLCGDRRVVSLGAHFVSRVADPTSLEAPGGGAPAEWKRIHMLLSSFIDSALGSMANPDPITGQAYESCVVFIDTNPSMNIFTEMGMCAAKKLVVPVNADDYSVAAIENMFYLLYGMYSVGAPWADRYERKMFHTIASGHPYMDTRIELPKVHAIIHNRSSIFGGKPATCFDAMSHEQAKVLYKVFCDARDNEGQHAHIFNVNQYAQLREPRSVEEFSLIFTGVMRDMGSTAVSTTRGGLPLWLVKRNKRNIRASLAGAKISNGASASLADIIGPAKKMARQERETPQGDEEEPLGEDGNEVHQRNGRNCYLIELIQGQDQNRLTDEQRQNMWHDADLTATQAGFTNSNMDVRG